MKRFWRVATLSRQVLVEATDETEARTLGKAALRALYPHLWQNVPMEIRTVALATEEDVEFWQWHQDQMARDQHSENS